VPLLAVQLIDAILFLNVRAVVCTVQKRFTAFMRYLAATHNLSAIFPDASSRYELYLVCFFLFRPTQKCLAVGLPDILMWYLDVSVYGPDFLRTPFSLFTFVYL
jgi:hypothetical protein